ncbi:MAG TPA: glycosyltransferase family 4 protein [Gemmatimonadaceae bacterium]|nr:glycosyltransferase family 4 protein [Gemmatimonadaceae bacterium]
MRLISDIDTERVAAPHRVDAQDSTPLDRAERIVTGSPLAAPDGVQGPPRAPSRTGLRIGVLCEFAPRKLGSWEGWLVAVANEVKRRGHKLDVYGREPIHHDVRSAFEDVGARWRLLAELEGQPARAVRRLASEYDVLHLNYMAPRQLAALLAFAAAPTAVLFVDHSSINDLAAVSGRSRFARFVDRVTLSRIKYHIGVSNYVGSVARQRYGLPANRFRVIHNGVDIARYHPRGGPADWNEFRILAVANLIPEKGVQHLIRAFAALSVPRARLMVAGDGPQESSLRELADELGVSARTTFLGLRDDLPDLLRTTDVFVHSAVWQEAFGLTVAEAMASGCPVVASHIGAMEELVDESCGVLLPPGDVPALAAALHRLAHDAPLRQRMGERARQRAVDLFGLDRCIKRHLDLCEEVAG